VARLTDAQRLDWLRLIRSENVGPRTFRALVNHYGGAGAALDALPGLARQRLGKPIKVAARDACLAEMEAMTRLGAFFVAVGEPDYPEALRAIDAPPPLLSVRGRLDRLREPMVAIVGSRNASGNGLAFAERLAREIGAAGYVVSSGLARGVDARAHRASLATGTLAVLAGGLDRVYPNEHAKLADEVVENGALVSEMPLGYEPRGRDFPRRNRIVSGVALATIVVEASRRSGSLITARFANEQGREVFAVPGSPLDPRAEGTNDLLRQGASLCTSAGDVLQALEPLRTQGVSPQDIREDAGAGSEPLWDESDIFGALPAPLASREFEFDEQARGSILADPEAELRARLVQLLGPTPIALDDLIRAAEYPASRVRTALLELELDGQIERQSGDLVSLAPTAV
jgi:DNA processing protein